MAASLNAALLGVLNGTEQLRGPQLFGSFSSVDELIDAVKAASPFLARVLVQDPDALTAVLASRPDDGFPELIPMPLDGEDADAAKKRLRCQRKRMCLAVALCDYAGLLPVDKVIRALSDFADACLEVAIQAAWTSLADQYFEQATPMSGVVLIGMGKLGARELNYSSDIDFVAVYDPETVAVPSSGRLDAKAVAVKLVQSVVSILNDQTADGIVFRTDLRLRPNPGATPVAVSLAAAETYYQIYGQNWERAAFIKARPCAGDFSVFDAFEQIRQPFVWRRTLDFGAVADIYAVKKQIHAEKGNPELRVRGGDIKLGPGGIREIEFFVQMQQLLLGGRDVTLRSSRTVEALAALADAGHVSAATAAHLSTAYALFRQIEHRLQMREDAQTHTVPEDDGRFTGLSLAMGEGDPAAFEEKVLDALRYVHDAYAELFATPEPDDAIPGSLVFTGVEDDPRTVKTLTQMGFGEPPAVISSVRRWHQGGLRATKSTRARELLTALVPRMLDSLSDLDAPDTVFEALNRFLAELPSGYQIFSLFTAHPEILDDIILLCESAPGLAGRLGRQPALVESLLEEFNLSTESFSPLPEDAPFEAHLDEVRRWVNEYRTRVAVGVVLGRIDPIATGAAFANVAEQAVRYLTDCVIREMPTDFRHGAAALCVLAFGRLGAEALTTASDLDLVFIYQADADGGFGEAYFNRLIRRIVSALSVPTAEGELFEIDMKLRPSGGAGPTAVSIASFDRYYAETAWVWEEMALTKARVVYSEGPLAAQVDRVLRRTFQKQRDNAELQSAVVEMRDRLFAEKPPRSDLDLKRAKGGITDVEFIIQYLTLKHPSEEDLIPTNVRGAIAALCERSRLSVADATDLCDAYETFEAVTYLVRAVSGAVPPQRLTRRQERVALRALGIDPEKTLDGVLSEKRHTVQRIWGEMFGAS